MAFLDSLEIFRSPLSIFFIFFTPFLTFFGVFNTTTNCPKTETDDNMQEIQNATAV